MNFLQRVWKATSIAGLSVLMTSLIGACGADDPAGAAEDLDQEIEALPTEEEAEAEAAGAINEDNVEEAMRELEEELTEAPDGGS